MKNSQVYFIHQCQIQYYDYNTNEKASLTTQSQVFKSIITEKHVYI